MTEKKAAEKADEKKSGSAEESADRVLVPNHDDDTAIVESIIEPAAPVNVAEVDSKQRAHVSE